LALNIDAQRDVFVTRRNFDGYCLGTPIGQRLAIQIHGTDCTSWLVENHNAVRTVFRGLYMSLVLDEQRLQ